MRTAQILDLRFILDCLLVQRRIHRVDYPHAFAQPARNREVYLALAQQHVRPLAVAADKFIHAVVGQDRHADALQLAAHVALDLRRVNEQIRCLFLDHRIREHERVKGDVVAAHIEEPGDIRKRRQDVHRAAQALHLAAQPGELGVRRDTRVPHVQQKSLFRWNCRTIRPERVRKVARVLYPDAARREAPAQLLSHGRADHAPVEPQTAVPGNRLHEICLQRRDALLPHAHQPYA